MDVRTPAADEHARALPLWARAADLLAIALFAVGGYVAADGGFVARVLGIRVALRSEWRLYAWAAAFVLVRHVLVRRRPLPARLVEALRRVARLFGPHPGEPWAVDRDAAAPSTRRRAIANAAGVLVAFAALTALMTWPQVRGLDRAVTPDSGD